jgi:UDPglucose 6-dehydrogenase
MKVAVIGTGYVGLVTGACPSEMGNHALCLDVDERKIEILNSGGIPIHEPGLEEMVKRNAADGRLQFTTDIAAAVHHGTLQFIGVGTPPDEDGSADLQYVLAAARSIGQHMTDYKVIVDKSTVPVGTADRVRAAVQEVLAERGVSVDFAVVSNPEFLKEGAAVEDFMRPNSGTVYLSPGASGRQSADYCSRPTWPGRFSPHGQFKSPDESGSYSVIWRVRDGVRRYFAGAPRHRQRPAHRHALSLRWHRLRGVVLSQGREGAGPHRPRGHDRGVDLRVLTAVEAANDSQKRVLVDKVVARFGEDLQGRCFALWGLAFKPNTDDMREAPSRVIVHELLRRGAAIRAYDPVAMDEARRVFGDLPGLSFASHQADALRDADALLIVTEWRAFKSPDFEQMRALLKQPLIFDGRNLFDPALVRSLGLEYHAIGRGEA